MDEFDPEQYRRLITKIEHAVDKMISDFNQGVRNMEREFNWVPEIGKLVQDGLKEASRLNDRLAKTIQDSLEAAEVPIRMWEWADTWEKIGSSAGDSANQLALLDRYQDEWGGIAGGSYSRAVAKQEPAVSLVQSRADSMSSACRTVSIGGFAFYMSIAAAVVSAGFVIASFAIAESGPPAVIALISGLTGALVSVSTAIASLELGVNSQKSAFQMIMQESGSTPGPSGTQWPTSANS